MQPLYSCPNCKASLQYGERFCTDCGTEITWPEALAATHYQTPPGISYEQQQAADSSRRAVPRKKNIAGSIATLILVLLIIAAAGGVYWHTNGDIIRWFKSPVVAAFDVSSSTITSGQSATLEWDITGAQEVSISPDIGEVAPSGSITVHPTTTTTYKLIATNISGTSRESITITVNLPTPPNIGNFTVSPATIIAGDSATLSWNVTDAEEVSISPGIGTVASHGSLTISPATTTTYTLTATNDTGPSSATAGISVTSADPPVITSFTASPATMTYGSYSLLQWNVTDATSINISPSVGAVSSSGTQYVYPISNTTYTLTATNSYGSVTKSTTVKVSTQGYATAEIISTYGMSIGEDETYFVGSMILRVTNDTDESVEDVELEVTITADDDMPDISSATLTGGSLTWTLDDQDDTELVFSNSSGLDVDADSFEQITLTLYIYFDEAADDDIDFEPSVEVTGYSDSADYGYVSAQVTSQSGLSIDDGEDDFTGTVVVKVYNNADAEVEDVELEITIEADETIPDISAATLTGGGFSWTLDDVDATELVFSNSSGLDIDEDSYEKMTLTLNVYFDDAVDEDINFEASVDVTDYTVSTDDEYVNAEVTATSGLSIAEGEAYFTGTVVVKVYNNTDAEVEDVELELTIEADEDMPDTSSTSISGGGLTWILDDSDETELVFSNSSGLDIDEDSYKKLTLTLYVYFDDTVDADISFDVSLDVTDYN